MEDLGTMLGIIMIAVLINMECYCCKNILRLARERAKVVRRIRLKRERRKMQNGYMGKQA